MLQCVYSMHSGSTGGGVGFKILTLIFCLKTIPLYVLLQELYVFCLQLLSMRQFLTFKNDKCQILLCELGKLLFLVTALFGSVLCSFSTKISEPLYQSLNFPQEPSCGLYQILIYRGVNVPQAHKVIISSASQPLNST